MRNLYILILSLFLTTNAFAGVDFSGDTADKVDCGDVTDLDGATSMTVAAVVDIDSLAAQCFVISKADTNVGNSWQFQIRTDGSVQGGIDDGTNYSFHASNASKITTGAGVQTIVVVWNGGNSWNFYVDGSAAGDNIIAQSGTVGSLSNSTQPVRISQHWAGGAATEGCNGQIYQIDVWKNVALSSAQASQYNSVKRKDSGLILGADTSIWFDDAIPTTSISGVTVKDRGEFNWTCSGTDADSDSTFIGSTLKHQPIISN